MILGDHLARLRRGSGQEVTLHVPGVRWSNIAVYVVASVAAWAANETGFFIPPVVGMVVAFAGAMGLQVLRRR